MTAMPLTDAQRAYIRKIGKYYLKHLLMIQNYKNAQSYAIDDYKRYAANPALQKAYEVAWRAMPANYEAAMRAIDERLRKWVKKYAAKVFNTTLTDAEVDALVSEIKSSYGSPITP
jgi:hypothetical protein